MPRVLTAGDIRVAFSCLLTVVFYLINCNLHFFGNIRVFWSAFLVELIGIMTQIDTDIPQEHVGTTLVNFDEKKCLLP